MSQRLGEIRLSPMNTTHWYHHQWAGLNRLGWALLRAYRRHVYCNISMVAFFSSSLQFQLQMFDIVCSLGWTSRDRCCDLPSMVRERPPPWNTRLLQSQLPQWSWLLHQTQKWLNEYFNSTLILLEKQYTKPESIVLRTFLDVYTIQNLKNTSAFCAFFPLCVFVWTSAPHVWHINWSS